jgi:putative membrane protein
VALGRRPDQGPYLPSDGGRPTQSSPTPERTEPKDGANLDARFTFANERTFLAWNRTALALIATGVAATQLLPKLHVAWGRRVLGLPLIALGAMVAAESFRHWRANERAMEKGEELPRSTLPLVLTAGIVVVGALAAVIAAFGTG